jgi:hypothetical protein
LLVAAAGFFVLFAAVDAAVDVAAAVVAVAAAGAGATAELVGLLVVLALLPQADRRTAAANVGMMHFMDRGIQSSCGPNGCGSLGALAAKDGSKARFLPPRARIPRATTRSGT